METVRKRQVISEETSALVCQLLESVVSEGGGGNAYVPGYRVGGKTGTSQKVADELQSTTGERLRISSFCGIAPMDDPQVAVLVVLDEPHADNVYGGTIAAPVGGQILADILPYMGVEPQYTEEELESMAINPPDVVGKSVSEARAEIQSASLRVKVVGEGETVERQVPASTQSIAENGIVVLYTEGAGESTMVTVPDLTGMAVAGVNVTAADANLNVEFAGAALTSSGAVSYQQSVAAGEQVEAGTTITVYFRTEDNVE